MTTRSERLAELLLSRAQGALDQRQFEQAIIEHHAAFDNRLV